MSAQDLNAAIAVTRFGLGARAGEIAAARGDPRGFLKAQIRREGADLPLHNGETSAQRIAAFREYRQDRQDMRAEGPDGETPDASDPVKIARRMLREDTATDFLGRFQLAVETPAGFRERWALFWANHFTVSATKLVTATVVGPFEIEAIRPNVFGAFADLLGAAVTHPAMLLYLDQAQSIGPNSRAAQLLGRGRRGNGNPAAAQGRRLTGLNENLAREILELHTVGIDGGYSQADVTEFARAMTGLSVGGLRQGEMAGMPVFRDLAHEPGARTVMGVRYPEGGRDQVAAILTDLAAKPQAARFICAKIARHFVADAPPPALVGRLERTWLETGGALDRVAAALIEAPEAWDPEPRKFKTPYEFVVSGWRAAGQSPRGIARVAPVLNGMGQKAFSAPSPKGWPEEAAAWANPAAVIQRMTYAQAFTAAATGDRDPKVLAAETLGARLAPATATAIARAESRAEGFALLLMSPEFQRR